MFDKIWTVIGKYVIIAGIVIISLCLLYYSLNGKTDKVTQDILDKYLAQYTSTYKTNMDAKDKELAEKDKELTTLAIKLNASQTAYLQTKAELDKLKKEAISINEPADLQEIKNRLRTLGYTIR